MDLKTALADLVGALDLSALGASAPAYSKVAQADRVRLALEQAPAVRDALITANAEADVAFTRDDHAAAFGAFAPLEQGLRPVDPYYLLTVMGLPMGGYYGHRSYCEGNAPSHW